MKRYIDKDALVAEIERRMKLRQDSYRKYNDVNDFVAFEELEYLHDEFLPTLEVKEMDLTDRKTDWRPSKKQMESLKDMLRYNIGVFDYQKFMEVHSLYDDLTEILDYETDRQK